MTSATGVCVAPIKDATITGNELKNRMLNSKHRGRTIERNDGGYDFVMDAAALSQKVFDANS